MREDHVKLRIGGRKRIAGCYVHGSDRLTFKRRAYHLLDYETGQTAVRPKIAGVKKINDNWANNGGGVGGNQAAVDEEPSLILIHYLDTEEASMASDNRQGNEMGAEATKRGGKNSKQKSSDRAGGPTSKRRRSDVNKEDSGGKKGRPNFFLSNDGAAAAAAAAIPTITAQSLGAMGQNGNIANNITLPLNTNNNNSNNQLQQLQNTARLLGQQQMQLQQNLALLPLLQQIIGHGSGGNINAVGLQQVKTILLRINPLLGGDQFQSSFLHKRLTLSLF